MADFHLYQAFMASSREDCNNSLMRFIALRDQRERTMGEFIQYENLVETVEGPAWYVEFKAYTQISKLPDMKAIQKYGDYLKASKESALHLRSSCYSSGLFICLLLDKITPTWQEDFMGSDLTLYAFLKSYIDQEPVEISNPEVSIETEKLYSSLRIPENRSSYLSTTKSDITLLLRERSSAANLIP